VEVEVVEVEEEKVEEEEDARGELMGTSRVEKDEEDEAAALGGGPGGGGGLKAVVRAEALLWLEHSEHSTIALAIGRTSASR
jgi:hypothetical protein